MLVERIPGGWSICALVGGYLERRRYFEYSRREAIAEFRAETETETETETEN